MKQLEVLHSDFRIPALAYKFDQYLDRILSVLEEGVDQDTNKSQYIAYEWSFEAKEVCVLLRDVMCSFLKMEVYYKNGLRDDAQRSAFVSEAILTIQEASTKLYDNYHKPFHNIKSNWEHQTGPVAILSQQIKELQDQIKRIARADKKLYQISKSFEDYRRGYSHHISLTKRKLNENLEVLQEVINSLEQSTPEALNNTIGAIDQQIKLLENLMAGSELSNIVLEDIERLDLPVATHDTQLVTKSINVLSEVSSWIALNIDGELAMTEAHAKVQHQKILHTLIQVNNRLKVLHQTNADPQLFNEIKSEVKSLKTLMSTSEIHKLSKKLDEIELKINSHINTVRFYDEEVNFLPISTIGQISQSFLGKLGQKLSNFDIKNIISGEQNNLNQSRSYSQSLTNVIEPLLQVDEGNDRHAIFLRKGYLGASFTIERKVQVEQVQQHFEDWQNGYGGALCINGLEGSGRTTLLEKIPLMYPQIESHHIVQDVALEVNGRKYEMTQDLMATLHHIKTYMDDEPTMVTIDDLAQYAYTHQEMYDLFGALSEFILKESHRIYIVVVFNRALYDSLSMYYDMDNIFSAKVNMDQEGIDAIKSALVIRARATTSQEDWEKNMHAYNHKAGIVAKNCRGNYGLAMQFWLLNRDILSYSNNLSLMASLMEKYQVQMRSLLALHHVTVPSLIATFDDAEGHKFRHDLEALINYKILVPSGVEMMSIQPQIRPIVDYYFLQLIHAN